MELEPKHITSYLPFRLKAEMLDYKSDYVGKQYDEIVGIHQWDKNCLHWCVCTVGGSKPSIKRIKPILRPLSDLVKEIEINGTKYESVEHYFEEIYYTQTLHKQVNSIIQDERWVNHCEYILVEFLFEHHFDVFGLIEKGLAIDINTLND